MGYKNVNKRVANQANEYERVEIFFNNKKVLGGDKTTVCVVWNNAIGANMKNKNEHDAYLSFLKSNKWSSGTYEMRGDGQAIIETCHIEIP